MRRLATALGVALMALASTVVAVPSAAAAAGVVITSPAAGALVSGSSPVAGAAESPAGVASVTVAALRPSDNMWLQPGGDFGLIPFTFPARLARPGQPSTTWSARLPLPAGDVLLVARATARDASVAEVATSARVATRPMLTLLLGRAMLGPSAGCKLVPGQPTIFDIAAELSRRGMFAVGVVVPSRTADATVTCENGNLYPSWADYARLRDTYGWSFVSNGQNRLDLPSLGRQQQIVEACGSLDSFTSRGHLRAWGLFGPNSNQITDGIATDVLAKCFGFTRLYSGPRTEQGRLVAPYYEHVRVAGGGPVGAYDAPAMVLQRFGQLRDGDWGSLGTYKFVVGRSPTPGGWDCTSPNPGAHWTLGNETYCWQDYLAILDALGGQRPEIVEPATVAERWGRVPTLAVEGVQVPAQAAAGAPVPVRFTAFESGEHWLLAGGSCAGGGRLLAAGQHRSGTQAVVNVPAGSLPRGAVALQLCVHNAFGRTSATALHLTIV